MEVIAMIMVFVLGGGSLAVYSRAPEDFDKLAARAAQIARSKMGGKAIEAPMIKPTGLDETAMAIWQAQFEGKSTDLVIPVREVHRVVKSWSEIDNDHYEGTNVKWFWECQCGEKASRKSKEAAKMVAKRHVNLYHGRDTNGVKDEGWLRGRGL